MFISFGLYINDLTNLYQNFPLLSKTKTLKLISEGVDSQKRANEGEPEWPVGLQGVCSLLD